MNIEIPEALRYFSADTHANLPDELDQYPYFRYELEGKKAPWQEAGNGLALLEPYWEKHEAALEEKQIRRDKEVKGEVDALLALFFYGSFLGK